MPGAIAEGRGEGQAAQKTALILSFSRGEKELKVCRGAHYLPFSSVYYEAMMSLKK